MGGRGAGLGGKSAISITFKDGKISMFRMNDTGVLLENGRPSNLKTSIKQLERHAKSNGLSVKTYNNKQLKEYDKAYAKQREVSNKRLNELDVSKNAIGTAVSKQYRNSTKSSRLGRRGVY